MRVHRAARLVDEKPMNGWIAAALWIFTLGIGAVIYIQARLNRVWQAVAASELANAEPTTNVAA
jgi:hypothetical protein